MQAFNRVYNPYLQFIYQRNAYHFYSPDPGPASVLVFLLKTETGTDPVTGSQAVQDRMGRDSEAARRCPRPAWVCPTTDGCL